MTMQEITQYLDNKINEDENLVIITFYEVRIKFDLSEEETQEFLRLCRTRLENLGYQVYFTGAKYMYQGVNKVVQSNELMVAIKDNLDLD